MYNVKFHCNYCSDEEIYQRVVTMTPNNTGRWKNVNVVKDNYDVFVIMNYPMHDNYDKSKTIVFESETPTTRRLFPAFYQGRETEFLHVHKTESFFNVDLWYHGMSFDELTNPLNFEKTRSMSIVNSSLNNLPGHIKRNNFISKLAGVVDYDLYGRGYSSNPRYRGGLNKKYQGLVNYKYTFNCENDFEPNYFTEKILDGVMCENLTFYYGCPNIINFINPNAFIDLDLNNEQEALYIIRDCINNDIWRTMIPDIKEEKRRIMVDYNVLNIINNILDGI